MLVIWLVIEETKKGGVLLQDISAYDNPEAAERRKVRTKHQRAEIRRMRVLSQAKEG